MSGTAYASDAPRAIQLWLNFAAVNPGSEPTPAERHAARIVRCAVCDRAVLGAGYRRTLTCSFTCAETLLHKLAKVKT